MSSTPSYSKVFYDLRPAKQVERRMIIETLQVLMIAGFPIRNYQYTGMGSVYFVDFSLLHRHLGLTRFLSAEKDKSIKKRVSFNRPFGGIEIAMTGIGEVIPGLDQDIKHLLWLDYDFRMQSVIVQDTSLAASRLPAGSLLLVTVDVEPPTDEDDPSQWETYFEREAGTYLDHAWTTANYRRSALPDVNSEILFRAIGSGLAARPNVRFLPLFKFWYADGHEMITIGGMLATDDEEASLRRCDFLRMPFVRRARSDDFYRIRVPRLTRKERMFLDRDMPATPGWKPKAFELSAEDIAAYQEIYRYYPIYGELLF